MGDAVFGAGATWSAYADVLVIWGDQLFISTETLNSALRLHSPDVCHRVTLPLVQMSRPYVQYCFDDAGRLAAIRQSREGDSIDDAGLADVGTFLLSAGGLDDHWTAYVAQSTGGRITGELNFLPFLTYLSLVAGWSFRHFLVGDLRESRGINTAEDLAFFQELLEKEGSL